MLLDPTIHHEACQCCMKWTVRHGCKKQQQGRYKVGTRVRFFTKGHIPKLAQDEFKATVHRTHN